jgi:hypothetical protein
MIQESGKRGQATLFWGEGRVRGLVRDYVVRGKEEAMIPGYLFVTRGCSM